MNRPARRGAIIVAGGVAFGERRRRRGLFVALLCVALSVTGGCLGRTIEFEPADLPGGAGEVAAMDWSDWGLTLSRAVVGDKVDYARVLANREPLDRFLSLVSVVGPESTPRLFPTHASRLAYALNCYNATILHSVLEFAKDGKAPSEVPPRLERLHRYRIDGRHAFPADLRRRSEALAGGDWRVRFGMCDGRRTGPPLPRRVFLGDLLDAQLNQVCRSALSSPEVVRIEHGERKRLLVWRGMYEIKNRLVQDYEARLGARDADLLNVLIEWSDRARREALNSAVGYEIARLAVDDRPNALDPVPEQGGDLLSIFKSVGSFSFLRP
jgi:hypothetical protein